MPRGPSRELGNYLLEVAGIMIGAAVLIVGASDVVRVLQARSAVRAAVNDGIRCLYPTDAGCLMSRSAVSPGPLRAFDVWVWGAGYQIPQESYLANARWTTEPVYEASLLSATLTGIEFEQAQYQYERREVLYPTTAHTPYFLQISTLPVVTGGTPLAPMFSDPRTKKEARPQRVLDLSSVNAATSIGLSDPSADPYRPEFKIGSVSFPVRGAWPTMTQDLTSLASVPSGEREKVPCYFGPSISTERGEVLDWDGGRRQLCAYRPQGGAGSKVIEKGALRVPLMLRVTGSTTGSSQSGQGKILLAISWRSPSSSASMARLGGRIITDDSSGNFVPRGLARDDISAKVLPLYASYENELSFYRELPLVPVDATVTVDFYLLSNNSQSVSWRGGALEVFYPKFRFVHESFDCGYSPNPAQCARPGLKLKPQYVSLSLTDRLITRKMGDDVCSPHKLDDVELDERSALVRIEDVARSGGYMMAHSFLTPTISDPRVCAPQRRSKRCSSMELEYLDGCEAPTPSDQLATSCGVSDEEMRTITGIRATFETNQTRTIRTRACSDEAMPECALARARIVDYSPLFGSKKCDQGRGIVTPQLVIGPLPQNSCEDRIDEVRRIYKMKNKIPDAVEISVTRLPSPPAYSAEPPRGGCVPYEPARGSSNELICGRGVSDIAVDRCCAASDGRCRKQEVIRTGEPENGSGDDQVLLATRQRVVEAVQAAYPPARYQSVCGESDADCLEVRAELSEGGARASISARMRVGLSLLQPFERTGWFVEHSTSRVLERVALQ